MQDSSDLRARVKARLTLREKIRARLQQPRPLTEAIAEILAQPEGERIPLASEQSEGFLSEAGRSISRGLFGSVESLATGAYRLAQKAIPESMRGPAPEDEDVLKWLHSYTQAAQPKENAPAPFLSQTVPEFLGGIVPAVGAGAVAGPLAAAGVMGTQGGEAQYEASKAATGEADPLAVAGGAAIGAAGVLGPAGALGRIGSGLAREAIGGALITGASDVGTQGLAKATYAPERPIDWMEALKTAAAGGIVGAAMHAPRALAGLRPTGKETPQPAEVAPRSDEPSAPERAAAAVVPATEGNLTERAVEPLVVPGETGTVPEGAGTVQGEPPPPAVEKQPGVSVSEPVARAETPQPEAAQPVQPPPGWKPSMGGADQPFITSNMKRVVAAEREARGADPLEETAARAWGPVWDEAGAALERNRLAADELVEELNKKPRPLSDVENALILRRRIEARRQFNSAVEDVNAAASAFDEQARLEASVRHAVASDTLLEIERASKLSNAETGRGLNAIKMMADQDYTLASMETRKRAVNGGARLTAKQAAEIKALHERIAAADEAHAQRVAELETQLASAEKRKSTEDVRATVKAKVQERRAARQQRIEKTRAAIEETYKEIAALSTRARSGLDADLVKAVTKLAAQHIDLGYNEFAKWADEAVARAGEQIRPYLEQAWQDAHAAAAEERRLRAYKARTERSTEKTRERTAAGDFEPRKRADLVLDKQAHRLKADSERAKQEFRAGLMQDRLAKRKGFEKGADWLVKWRRFAALSSPNSLAKLTSAGVERIGFTALEDLIGAAAPGKLKARAPREGGFNVRAQAKAVTEAFTRGMRDAADAMKTGSSDIQALFDEAPTIPEGRLDFFNRLHQALKSPTKRHEFTLSFEKRAAWAMRNGLDVSEPLVQTRIALDAYKDANRSIFLQDNRVVDGFNRLLRAMEEPNKVTGEVSPYGKAGATAGRVLLPIVRVPTNIVAETFQYAFGSLTGGAQLARAYAKGIETLPPEKADMVLRQLKKGSVGAAVLLLGYLNAENVGGYYQPGKRDEKDVDFGGLRIFGVEIPSVLVHNSLLECLQLGATVRRVSGSLVKGEERGLDGGVRAAMLGLIEEVPFIRETVDVGHAFEPNDRSQTLQRTAAGVVVPQAVSWAARLMDHQQQRKPQGMWQQIEAGIPGLRQNVPLKNNRAWIDALLTQ